MMEHRTVTLTHPIRRACGTELWVLTLREPLPGDLRDIFITDLLQMKGTALLALLPRISLDGLSGHEARQLSFADLVQVGGIVIGFAMDAVENGEAG